MSRNLSSRELVWATAGAGLVAAGVAYWWFFRHAEPKTTKGTTEPGASVSGTSGVASVPEDGTTADLGLTKTGDSTSPVKTHSVPPTERQADNGENQRKSQALWTKRLKTLEEFVSSEQAYVDDLTHFVELVLQPAKTKKLLPSDLMAAISCNFEGLVVVHKDLLSSMKQALDGSSRLSMAEVLLTRAAVFKAYYRDFMGSYERCIEALDQIKTSKKHQRFKTFLKEMEQVPQLRRQKIDSFIIMPVQRIPRYELLLRDLLHRTSDEESRVSATERQKLSDAIAAFNAIAISVNERSREIEQILTVAQIQKQASSAKVGTLLRPGRSIVRQGPLLVSSSISKDPKQAKPQQVFLFSDALLWHSLQQNMKVKGMLDLVTAKVMGDKEGEELLRTIKIDATKKWSVVAIKSVERTTKGSVTLLLLFDQADQHKDWLDDISKCIANSQQSDVELHNRHARHPTAAASALIGSLPVSTQPSAATVTVE